MHVLQQSFNTASGRYCCNQYQSNYYIAQHQPCFNTASGRYCCNKLIFVTVYSAAMSFNTASGRYCCNQLLLITTARDLSFNTASGRYCCNQNIPLNHLSVNLYRFNTASGRYCCNRDSKTPTFGFWSKFQYRKR